MPFGVRRVSLFGSVARGEDSPESDIDILVQFKKPVGLLTLARLRRILSQKLGRKVDLLTEGAINPLIRPIIEKDKVILYEER
ncbi:hypothetical protein DRP77_05020 [Candidatus Poribacteria bacterium]|nr:MAG: hypothetical protein DRP77_05020 [Candidatus Poribacteria bacterium]